MLRRSFLGSSIAAACLPRTAGANPVDTKEWFEARIIPAPDAPGEWPAYREALAQWRQAARQQVSYDDSLYRRSDFAWVPSSFACGFIMMCDEMFYDSARARYRVDEWVNDGIREFGGYDSVVLWHAYPRIGLDPRNQFDFYRDMPGGLAGLRTVAQKFQARGVKVYIDYNPWDTGTRREAVPDLDAVVDCVKAIGADGIFLDTLSRGAADFRAKLDSVRPGVVLEGELALPLANIHDHHMSWAQGFQDTKAPGVLRDKWFERRHMQHQIRRWNHDHTSELHVAWMNGSGMMIWENVFGSWAGWSPRDRSILRSMLPIQRRYSEVFAGEDWSPLVATDMPDVYASQWNHGQQRLWTLVNRAAETREGVLLSVPHTKGSHYFDLVHGREINVTAGDAVKLSGSIRPRGIACFLASPTASLGKDFAHFTAAQAQIELRADFGADSPVRPVSLRSASSAKPKTAAPPADMAAIGPVAYDMRVELRARETGYYTGQEYAVGKGYAPETPPAPGAPLFGVVHVTRKVNLNRYAIGLTPVTNAQYADFLHASGYRPKLAEKFLNHWADGAPPAALRDHPVVYVDLEDARAYATWAGKRLPSEEEWQYAAQGPEGRRYPWGDAMRPGVCNGGETKGTTAVTAFPDGRSAFGCYDLCGNVWEWTESERTDGRTRFAMIRGGSYYEAKGSHWYMDGGPQPCNFAAKVLLMWPGLDRCSTIGFRCAVDL